MKTINAFSRDDFRTWLQKNHTTEVKVGIILHKRHTGKTAPTHRELIEEAICFGWIDTIIKRIDEHTYMRTFTRRNINSRWSENTQGYAKKLVDAGKMTTEGLKFYTLGLKRKTHDYGIPKNPDMPDELKKALAKNKTAQHHFDNFPPSAKRMFYRWILHAKLLETRTRRIAVVVNNAEENKRRM